MTKRWGAKGEVGGSRAGQGLVGKSGDLGGGGKLGKVDKSGYALG